MRPTILIALLATSLTDCASAAPFVATGEALKLTGNEFVVTATLMDTGYDAKTITAAQYVQWKTFGEKFQLSFPLVVKLWESARQVNDRAMEKQVAAILVTVINELSQFYVMASAAVKAGLVRGSPQGSTPNGTPTTTTDGGI